MKKLTVFLTIFLFLTGICFCRQKKIDDESGFYELKDYIADSSYPQDYWKISTPEAQGMKIEKLMKAVEFIKNYEYEIHSMLIVKNGFLVFERYGYDLKSKSGFNPYKRHILYSTTKSFTSCLIGIAIQEKYISGVNDKMISYFSGKQITNKTSRISNITIADLLTMRSGYDWNDSTEIGRLYFLDDPVSDLLNRPITSEPGTRWNYDSGSCHLLTSILAKTTGKSVFEFAKQKIFIPLGITNVYWAADRNGLNYGGFGLEMTPRDMAKFGYLYLKKGVWNGTRLLPETWVNDSSRVYSDTYWPANGKYGYLFWIPDEKYYCTSGRYGQKIYIFPELDMVAVFTANLRAGDADETLNNIVSALIVPSVNGD